MLHGVWVECDTSYVHTGLETDAYLLFRRVGILCEDFDKHLNTAGIKPINQRVYMRNTRQALKGKGKARQMSLQSDSSEGEVEFISALVYFLFYAIYLIYSTDTPIRKSIVKLEPSASSPSPFKRVRRHSPPSQGSSLSNAIEIQDSPATPSPLRLYSFSPPPVFSPPPAFSPPLPFHTPSGLLSPSPSPALSDIAMPPLVDLYPQISGRSWPASMYVVDMIPRFALMDQLKREGKGNYEARFMDVFSQPPPPMNTYHDQVRRWTKADAAARKQAISGGRTSSGEWSTFVKCNPLKRK